MNPTTPDLDSIYAHLPRLQTVVDAKAQLHGPKPSQTLREVFAWSIFARYSSSQATSREARDFLKKFRKKNLGDAGVECEIKIEPVAGTRMYRFFVISDGFAALEHSERQTVVWRIVDKALPQSDAVKVSMIMTVTRAEFGEENTGT